MTIDLQGLLRSALMTWAANSPRRLGLLSAREGSRAIYTEHIADTAISAAERYLTCLEHLDIPVERLDFQLTAARRCPTRSRISALTSRSTPIRGGGRSSGPGAIIRS